jgi:hypothetical protein
MRQWEYLRLDLNDAPRRGDETGVLNRACGEGWELVIVSRNGVPFSSARWISRRVPDAAKRLTRPLGSGSR